MVLALERHPLILFAYVRRGRRHSEQASGLVNQLSQHASADFASIAV
ncbi:hypothetical protein ISE1_2712 [plant metagenome]|uniref:Uncharacterized protein n=1 Tax=plant metagenome TaxID=1297885 RepID=A0A484UHX2_9ZZZZ